MLVVAIGEVKVSFDFRLRKDCLSFSCEYQPLELNFSPTMKQHSPESITDFNMNFSSFQKARNQENWPRKKQDAINFPKSVKPTSVWESCQPLPFSSNQTFLWDPGDHFNQLEDIQDVLSCDSTQEIRRIFIYTNLPYLDAFILFPCKERLQQEYGRNNCHILHQIISGAYQGDF